MMYYLLLITMCFAGSMFCADVATQVQEPMKPAIAQEQKMAEVTQPTVAPTAPTTTPGEVTVQEQGTSIAATPEDKGMVVEEEMDLAIQPGTEDKDLEEFRKYIEQYVEDESVSE